MCYTSVGMATKCDVIVSITLKLSDFKKVQEFWLSYYINKLVSFDGKVVIVNAIISLKNVF